jgi:hypothetical protein
MIFAIKFIFPMKSPTPVCIGDWAVRGTAARLRRPSHRPLSEPIFLTGAPQPQPAPPHPGPGRRRRARDRLGYAQVAGVRPVKR